MNSIRRLIITITLLALLPGATPLFANDAAISWSLQTAAGDTVNFPDQRDGPAILLFWASWCPYCKLLMPELQAIAAEYPGELSIYAINFRDDGDPAAYLQEHGYTFTLLLDGGAVAEQYGIHGTPGLLIFNADNEQIFNLYDTIEQFEAEVGTPEGLSHSEKAARKAPWWAAQIRAGLQPLQATE
jgi:thiol-disulfide isomerase/thioredoxin